MPEDLRAAFDQFGAVASEFCNVIESASSFERTDLLLQLYLILPRLIHQGASLPSPPNEDDDTPTESRKTRMKQAEWGQLYQFLKDKLGDWDLYWQVFDPIADSVAIRGSLADDIADIYRDVKEGLSAPNPDSALLTDIIFEWRVLYYSHWGQHAMNALRTIHFLLQATLE